MNSNKLTNSIEKKDYITGVAFFCFLFIFIFIIISIFLASYISTHNDNITIIKITNSVSKEDLQIIKLFFPGAVVFRHTDNGYGILTPKGK